MTPIINLFEPTCLPRFEVTDTELVAYKHLADAKQRGLIRSIGYDDMPILKLRALYGPSWGAIQPALRNLINAELIDSRGFGTQAVLRLNLAAFPARVIDNVLGNNHAMAIAA